MLFQTLKNILIRCEKYFARLFFMIPGGVKRFSLALGIYMLGIASSFYSVNARSDQIPFINRWDVESRMSWTGLLNALKAGHKLELAGLGDIPLKAGSNSMLSRSAWVKGMGIGTKLATVFPGNQDRTSPLPNIHAGFMLFDDKTGKTSAFIEGRFLTKWKTAGDSVLGSRLLARKDSKVLTIVGAGAVAESLIHAYSEVFPKLELIYIWNRHYDKAVALAQHTATKARPVYALKNLQRAVELADIVASATMSETPLIRGDWVQPGTHIDLIGAYRPDMREADDELILKSRIFVDSRETTIDAIGELMIPIEKGIISKDDVLGDLYDLLNNAPGRTTDKEITLFKNGGGAHLDLMTADYIRKIYAASGIRRYFPDLKQFTIAVGSFLTGALLVKYRARGRDHQKLP